MYEAAKTVSALQKSNVFEYVVSVRENPNINISFKLGNLYWNIAKKIFCYTKFWR